MSANYVSRINKLDAIQLDKAIEAAIHDQRLQLKDGFLTFLNLYQREFEIITNSFLWYYSITKFHATHGQQLLALEYAPDQLSRKTLALHYLATVFSKYCKSSLDQGTSRFHSRLQHFVFWLENAHSIAKLFVFFHFCRFGGRPNIVESALGLDQRAREIKRNVSYQQMTRELIWGGFIEFLIYTLPLVNFQMLRNWFRPKEKEGTLVKLKQPEMTTTTRCMYCSERPTLPHHMGCEHIYCYYCLEGNLSADSSFGCVICGHQGREAQSLVLI